MRSRGGSPFPRPGRGSGRSRRPGISRAPVGVAALAAAVLASGCALLGASSTPSGLSTYDAGLRGLLREGRYGDALRRVAEEGERVGDGLLRLQYQGLAAHYAGRWEESNAALERAAAEAEDRVTRSLSRGALSLVTSDRVLPYRPPPPERLLLHYYGALNYLRLDDAEEAAVEARRLVHLLEVYEERWEPEAAERGLHAAMRYVAGAAFEAAGEWNDASVAYRRAAEELDPALLPDWVEREAATTVLALTGAAPSPGAGPPRGAGPPGATAAPHEAAPPRGAGPPGDAAPTAEVLVIVEQGFVAHRVERSLNFFLRDRDLAALRPREDGEGEPDWNRLLDGVGAEEGTLLPTAARSGEEERAAAALALAERILADDAISADDALSADRRERRRRDGVPHLFRVAWPAFAGLDRSWGPLRIRLPAAVGSPASGDVEAAPAWGADISRALAEDFRRRQPALLAKAILRGVAKWGIAEALESEVEKKDEVLGEIAGLVANAGLALLERADTRSWHLAPARLGFVRLRLPVGVRTVAVEAPDFRGGRTLEARDVRVRPGRLQVVSVRAW